MKQRETREELRERCKRMSLSLARGEWITLYDALRELLLGATEPQRVSFHRFVDLMFGGHSKRDQGYTHRSFSAIKKWLETHGIGIVGGNEAHRNVFPHTIEESYSLLNGPHDFIEVSDAASIERMLLRDPKRRILVRDDFDRQLMYAAQRVDSLDQRRSEVEKVAPKQLTAGSLSRVEEHVEEPKPEAHHHLPTSEESRPQASAL